jgi:hypothetical protein
MKKKAGAFAGLFFVSYATSDRRATSRGFSKTFTSKTPVTNPPT